MITQPIMPMPMMTIFFFVLNFFFKFFFISFLIAFFFSSILFICSSIFYPIFSFAFKTPNLRSRLWDQILNTPSASSSLYNSSICFGEHSAAKSAQYQIHVCWDTIYCTKSIINWCAWLKPYKSLPGNINIESPRMIPGCNPISIQLILN